MYTYNSTLENVAKISGAIACEPAVTPNFKYLTLELLPATIFALVREQARTASEIYVYLDARGAPFDLETVIEVLNEFDGKDPESCLWIKSGFGKIEALFMDSPGEHPFLYPTVDA